MSKNEIQSAVLDKDTFCASAYQFECTRTNSFDFWAGFCITNSNMLDSRDVDFSLSENRLDYVLLHGFSVISFVEKGVSTYLKGLSVLEKNFLMKKNKICTMSNGPGFDIVGYFSALKKCGLKLNGTLELQCINHYQSWQPLFQWIITNAYIKVDYPKPLHHSFSVGDLFNVNRLPILGCGRFDSYDILLMVRVFQSTKAGPEIVSTAMMEIFTRLKEGSLIFYFGSKSNVQRVVQIASKFSSICVKLDPVKIVLEEGNCAISFLKDEWKPKSQFIFFTVFQKNSVLGTNANILSKRQASLDQMDSKSCVSDSSNPSSVSTRSSISDLSSIKYELDSVSSSKNKMPSIARLSTSSPTLKKCSNVDVSKANIEKKQIPASHSTHQTTESVNIGCVGKEVLEQVIQESIHKAFENLFHDSGLKLCNHNQSEVDHNHSLAKIVKESTYNSSCNVYKPLNNLSQASESSLVNVQLDEQGTKNKLSKSVQTSNSSINCLESNQGNILKYQSLNSLIEKCQNLIIAGKQLVSNIHDQTEHSSMNRSCIHECSARKFHEHNCCKTVSQPCHCEQTCSDNTLPCCSFKGLPYSSPCPHLDAKQPCCGFSSCPSAPLRCRSLSSERDPDSCCQDLSENLIDL